MRHRNKDIVCRQCGAVVKDVSPHTLFCPKCSAERKKAHVIAWQKRQQTKTEEIPTSESARAALLRTATSKPEWCSDVRWRIELRRRRDAQYYDIFGSRP